MLKLGVTGAFLYGYCHVYLSMSIIKGCIQVYHVLFKVEYKICVFQHYFNLGRNSYIQYIKLVTSERKKIDTQHGFVVRVSDQGLGNAGSNADSDMKLAEYTLKLTCLSGIVVRIKWGEDVSWFGIPLEEKAECK